MEFDVARNLGAVTRAVENLEHDGRPARKVVASRTYDAEIADVWDALTNPERIPRWFSRVDGELRLGGRFQVVGNAGGTVTACDPPAHFAVTWEMRGDVSWVDVRLTATSAGVRLDLEHLAHVPEEFWSQYGPGAVGVGWELALMGLARHLETGEAVDHEAAEAWTVSEEGKGYVRGASEGWGRASVAAGTPDAAASEAAARTTAFYTGAG